MSAVTSVELEDSELLADQRCAVDGERIKELDVKLLLFGSLALGVPFGFALQKSGLWNPDIVLGTFLLQNFILMKVFLSAVTATLLSMAFMSVFGPTKPYFELARNAVCPCDMTEDLPQKGLMMVLAGSTLFGAGMATSASCPGLLLVQLGSGTLHGLFVLLGCLLGALTYSFMDPMLRGYRSKGALPWVTVDQALGVPYALPAVFMGALLIAAGALFELYFPWREEVEDVHPYKVKYVVGNTAWPPQISGVIIGILSFPAILGLRLRGLGASSSYVTLSSLLVKLVAPGYAEKNVYMASSLKTRSWWQVLFVGGAVVGAFLSAYPSGVFGAVVGLPWWRSLFGGYIMLFGARIAGGCTSGHGITGFSQLAFHSMLAVFGMFAGGIPTAFLWDFIV